MTDVTHLDESLKKLRSEIDALDTGDQEARQRLEKLLQDIENTLENPKDTGGDENLGEQLKTSILRFEVSHPRLAAIMNDIMEKLSNMGI